MKYLKVFLLSLFLVFTLGIKAQEPGDTKFWFVAPDASKKHSDRPTFLMISTGSEPATVTISMPANTKFTPVTKKIDAYSYWKHEFTTDTEIDLIENAYTTSGTVTQKGIYIESDTKVFAYYQIDGGFQKEIFTFKGDKALGNEFYMPFQRIYSISSRYYDDGYRQIQIVATENNTEVTVYPTGNIANGNQSVSSAVTKILNKGETLLWRGYNQASDLTGTKVTSNKPIAVTLFEDCIAGNSSVDPIGDQLVPVNNLGRNYIIIKGFAYNNVTDHVGILAVEDGTVVSFNGTQQTTLAKGGYWSADLGGQDVSPQGYYIQTSKPAYCMHQSAAGSEIGGALLPSLYAISSRRISFIKGTMDINSIFLVFRESAKDNFKIDGVPLSITPIKVGFEDWMYAKADLTNTTGAQQVCVIENTAGAFSLGYFNGAPTTTAVYGYLSEFGTFSFASDTIYHCGSSYTLDAPYALSYKWTLPDKSTASTSKITATKSGKYILTVDQDPYTLTDTIYLQLQNFNHRLSMPVGSAFINSPYSFGVELNPQHDPDNVYKATYEWNFGDAASISTSNSAEVKGVSWSTFGLKTITLKIKNLDAICDTVITRQILVTNSPDDISNAECFIDPFVASWKPILKKVSDSPVHLLAQPLVGDIDGDGQPEVITTNAITSGGTATADAILIFDKELTLRKKIAIPIINTNTISPLALLKLTSSDKDALIVIATSNSGGYNYQLQAYKSDGTLVWTSSESIFNTGTSSVTSASASILIGDINNDGIPDIFAGDRIFNAINGKRIASLPDGSTFGRGYKLLNTGSSAFMPVLADVDNDGKLEIVAGNTTYKITIADANDATKNSVIILTQIASLSDGFVSVADINLDGQLDIVTITTNGSVPSLTVWDGTNGKIIAGPKSPSINGVGGSRVSIGNVNSDSYPELFFSYEKKLVGFSYNSDATNVSDKLVQKWITNSTDGVGGTSALAMFDFDQDGKSELIYQDGTNLRIIDGDTGNDKQILKNYSSSGSGYPVIVDFDGDKHADILVAGAETQIETTTNVRIKWLSGEKNDWAPARSVWNQLAYNVTHVNKDLTIPRYQVNPSTVFTGEDGSFGTDDDMRPYNSFLQQQTSLSRSGIPLYLVPNAKIIEASKIKFTYNIDTDSVKIDNLYITNVGNASLQAPIKITVYKDKVPSEYQCTYDYNKTIPVGQTDTISFSIPEFEKWLPVSNFIIRINDKGDGLNYQPVCDSCCISNTSQAFTNVPFENLAWADSYRKCENSDVAFDANTLPGANISYKWLTPNSDLLTSTKKAEKKSLKLSEAGQYIFKADNVNNQLSIIYSLPYLSVAPSIMYWRSDAKDKNWNNLKNWSQSGSIKDSIMAVPSSCTKVYIPGTSANFPSLDAAITDYSFYGNPTVENIIFHYGGELAYQHKLIYNKAYIDYNWGYYGNLSTVNYGDQPSNSLIANQQKRNSWYMLSSPLKKMVSGDFAFGGKPITWQAQFNITNPATGELIEGDFSKPYATNDINLSTTHNALALKVSGYENITGAKEQDNLEKLQGVLEIPYFQNKDIDTYNQWYSYDSLSLENKLFYFDTRTLQRINYPIGKIKRGNEAYRFIYETESNTVPVINIGGTTIPGYKQNVTIGNSSSSKVMIGNPFVAPINANAFYKLNSSVLNSEGYYVFSNETQTWSLKDYSIDNNIPPYQAFLITLADNLKTADLIFPLENDKSGSFRNSDLSSLSDNALYLRLENKDNLSADNAILRSGNTVEDNVTKMLFPEGHSTPEAFFITPDGKDYNLIQAYKEGVSEIGIGVKSSDTKSLLTFSFQNTKEFINENNIYLTLVDKLLNTEKEINEDTAYSFYQQSTNLTKQHVDRNRFSLRISSYATDNQIETNNNIKVSYKQNLLKIESTHNIYQIDIYDIYGRLLHLDKKIGMTEYSKEYNLPQGVYIIKVITETGISHVAKILSL